MLKLTEDIINYNSNKFKADIDNYILYISKFSSNKKIIIKNNIFYNKLNITFEDHIIELFNIYNIAKTKGGKYFLTNNIQLISYLYKKILELQNLNIIKLPLIIIESLIENIKSYELNNRLVVYKSTEYIKLLFVKENIYKKENFSNFDIDYILNENKNILNVFGLTYLKLIDKKSNILKYLFNRNVTTIFNRTNYDLDEAIIRIKKDFQIELITYLYLNNIDIDNINDEKEIIDMISNYLSLFGKNKLRQYIRDYVYFLHFYGEKHNIEILSEINELLLTLESSIIEDFNIISEDNIDLYNYIQKYLIICFKYGIIGNYEEDLFVNKENIGMKIKDFFNYKIYY